MAQVATGAKEKDNGLQANKLKQKKRKWKTQARSVEYGVNFKKASTSTKRLASNANWASPEVKRKKTRSPTIIIPLISLKAEQKWESEEQQDAGCMEMAVENMEKISVEAGHQPQRQS